MSHTMNCYRADFACDRAAKWRTDDTRYEIYAFSLIAGVPRSTHNFVMGDSDISPRNDRSSQIRNEPAQLYNEQTEFYGNGARAKHMETEIAEYEKRRERIRGLFAELDELRKATGPR